MIGIIDYGVGNLFSLQSSLRHIGAETVVSGDADVLRRAGRLILPGVGAFADAARLLRESGLDRVVLQAADRGTPVLGICLGMQLLFEKSYEFGEHAGLGLLRGSVVPMEGTIPAELKIPHIGWNALHKTRPHPLLQALDEGTCVYFVHSYYAADCDDSVIATTDYGRALTAAAARENVMGCQFHPEKSGEAGLAILRTFCEEEWKPC